MLATRTLIEMNVRVYNATIKNSIIISNERHITVRYTVNLKIAPTETKRLIRKLMITEAAINRLALLFVICEL